MNNISRVAELQIPTNIWYSQGDEESFFRWLYTIPGYLSCKGVGKILYVSFNISDMEKSSIQEVIAIFKRYCVKDMKQLNVFTLSNVGHWFSSEDKYWHNDIFM